MNLLVTGAAGFIGFHCTTRLLAHGHRVVGLDNLNSYYDVRLKQARLARLSELPGFVFERIDLADHTAMQALFRNQTFDGVIHLGAQAGVRHSLDQPLAYAESNLTGLLTVLEGVRQQGCGHLVYASSSSVYGASPHAPFRVGDATDHPISLYAATKKAGEVMAHAYAHLYQVPMTGLRFFTVYGPWGRPDMAYFKFAEAICAGRPIDLYNHGEMARDFTYVDDVVEGIVRVVERGPIGVASGAPHRIYNFGNNRPERLLDMVQHLERLLGRKAEYRWLPMQPGDVPSTHADIAPAQQDYGYAPRIELAEGLARFVAWYRDDYTPRLAQVGAPLPAGLPGRPASGSTPHPPLLPQRTAQLAGSPH